MTLASHLDVDHLEESVLLKHQGLVKKYISAKNQHTKAKREEFNLERSLSAIKISDIDLTLKYKIPQHGIPADVAYQSIHDELNLDGNPTLNLASFVNTFDNDPVLMKLIQENLTKNLADNDEYPIMLEMQQRCISILADLWHAPKSESNTSALGTATTGSSEAVMLGGLALKKLWQAKRKEEGKDASKPNILMSSCCQVALEKFARYFDVEPRIIPVDPQNDYLIDLSLVKENLDENTIGVFAIVGSTYTGAFEQVDQISAILDEYEAETGISIPIHVDGASGAMVAPFMYPNLKWDFRNERVHSINTSGHKFGLVTAGLGWVVWRDSTFLPTELRFELRYLGGVEESFNLNFSRSGFQVIHQYYNFLSLGFAGFRGVFDTAITNARLLSFFLEETGYFKCVSNIHNLRDPKSKDVGLSDHEKYFSSLPVVSFQFSEKFSKEYPEVPQSMIALLLRNRGFIVPNYPLPHTKEPPKGNNEILRVVVRYNLTLQLLNKLMGDILEITEILIKSAKLVRNSITQYNKATISEEDKTNVIYNMLLSIASEGDEKVMELKKSGVSNDKTYKHHQNHKSHHHASYRGTC